MFTRAGQVLVRTRAGEPPSAVLDRLADGLAAARSPAVRRDGDAVVFAGTLFDPVGWQNPLTAGGGRVWVEPTPDGVRVCYRLSRLGERLFQFFAGGLVLSATWVVPNHPGWGFTVVALALVGGVFWVGGAQAADRFERFVVGAGISPPVPVG